MGLIKANTAPATIAAFSMNDIEQQARALISRARSEADQIIAQAKTQADAMRVAAQKEGRAVGLEQGKKEGHKQGHDQGLAQGKTAALAEHREKFAAAVAALIKASAELDARLSRVDDTVRDELLRLSLAIARRVTKAAAARDGSVVEANVKEAIRLTLDKSAVRIAIHPAQRAVVSELLPHLKIAWPTLNHVELIDDESVGAGGCRVNSAAGAIDADIESQLTRIADELYPENV